LEWVRSKIPEYNINNFTSDWQSGKAICALAEAVLPGQMNLPRDFTNDPVRDAGLGMQKALDNMNIPMLLDPHDMVHEADELSNMTYISYYRDYLDMEARRREQELFERTPVAGKCLAYGPGLEPGNEAGIETGFTIEARNGADRRVPVGGHQFPVDIVAPSGQIVPTTTHDNGDGTYKVSYTPREAGVHNVGVTFNGQHIKASPFRVTINQARPDPTKCLAYGPGLEGGEAHSPAVFTVESRNRLGDLIPVGGHPYAIAITDPYGQPLHCDVKDNQNGTYTCTYNPVDPGDHHVDITLAGAHVAQAPYTVNIGESMAFASPHKSWADGPGLENGNKATDPQVFTIHAAYPDGRPKTTGGDLFDVIIEDPSYNLIPPEITDNNDGTWTVKYQPTDPGDYNIAVIARNPSNPIYFDHVKNSPKIVNIEPGTDASQTIAFGPGLEPGNLDTFPATFKIQAKDKHGNNMKEGGDPFVVEINGPSGPIHCDVKDNGDGTYDCVYHPDDAGRHDVSVTLDGKPIKGSTYHVDIQPGAWPGNTFIENFYFTVRSVDKRGANKTFGGEDIKVKVTGPSGEVPGVIVDDRKDGTYHITYQALASGDYQIHVLLNGQHIRGSPFHQKLA
jgi:filamin